jgi:hypothetical protein
LNGFRENQRLILESAFNTIVAWRQWPSSCLSIGADSLSGMGGSMGCVDRAGATGYHQKQQTKGVP